MNVLRLASRLDGVKPSTTLAMAARAATLRAAGHDVVSFAVGEPDFPTPNHIRQAAHDAIEGGFTRYTPVDGLPSLKDAIRRRMKRDQNLDYAPEQIMATVGGKGALAQAILATVSPGDEVIIPAPYWVSYPDMVRLAGGVPVIVPTRGGDGFRMQPDALAAHLGPRTRMVILNAPANPSGAAYTPDELRVLMEPVLRTDAIIISDEMYDRLVFDGFRCISPAALSRLLYDRTLVVNAVSKTYAMTGWRLGWCCGPASVIKAMTRLQGALTSNPPTISQKAAEAALDGPEAEVQQMVRTFDERRRTLVEGLNRIPGIRAPMPRGAFYAMADVTSLFGQFRGGRELRSDADVAEALLDDAHVVVVPGDAFGAHGYIRFSYACSLPDIHRGLERFERFVRGG